MGLLDPQWQDYLKRYPGVAADPYFAQNPQAHYEQYGQAEGRTLQAPPTQTQAPAAPQGWDAQQYMLNNPDVAAGGWENALNHYTAHGKAEGRTWDTPGMMAPETDYRRPETTSTSQPPPGWNAQQYLLNNPDVAAEGWDPLNHYTSHGKTEGRTWGATTNTRYSGVDTSNLAFKQKDTDWKAPEGWDPQKYLVENPDLADDAWASSNPLAHYALYGLDEGRQWGTGGYANTDYKEAGGIYLGMNPDVIDSGLTPWEHYQQYGKTEGRKWYGEEQNSQTHLLYTDKDFKPNEGWNGAYYLRDNPDLKDNAWAQANPLAHAALFGKDENRTYYNTETPPAPLTNYAIPTGTVDPNTYITTAKTNYGNYQTHVFDPDSPYAAPTSQPGGTLLAHTPGAYNPLDEDGNMKPAKAATRDDINSDNIAAIVALGDGRSHRVYYKNGSFSDLEPGKLEDGYIGRVQMDSGEGGYTRYINKDGTTMDLGDNSPSNFFAKLGNETGRFIGGTFMPKIFPPLVYAGMTYGIGSVLGAAAGAAAGTGSAAGTAGAGMSGMAGATVPAAAGGAVAAGGAAAGGAAAGVGASAAAAAPWYATPLVTNAVSSGLLSTAISSMQGKPIDQALTQGLISGALSYVGGSIVDGLGTTVSVAANNPAVAKAIVTGVLATGVSKLQGADWEDAITQGLMTGTISYVGGKLSGYITNKVTGQNVDIDDLMVNPQGPPSYTDQMLSSQPLSNQLTSGLTYASSSPSTPAYSGFGGYQWGGGSSFGNMGGGLSYSSPLSSPGYQSPIEGGYFSNEGPFANMADLYYQNNMPANIGASLRGWGFEGGTDWVGDPNGPPLEYAPPMDEHPGFQYGGNDPLGIDAFLKGLSYGTGELAVPGYESPLEGTMFGPGGGILGGYPGVQNQTPGSGGSAITKKEIKTILKALVPVLGGIGGSGARVGGVGSGGPTGGLLSLDEMPIPEYMKRKLQRKARSEGKTWQEYVADATRNQKAYYSHLA